MALKEPKGFKEYRAVKVFKEYKDKQEPALKVRKVLQVQDPKVRKDQ